MCRFAATDGGVVAQFNEGDAFGQLLGSAGRVAEQHAEMPGADVAAMYIAAASFVGAVYPDRLDYIDRVLSSCHDVRAWSGRRCNFLPAAAGWRMHVLAPCSAVDRRFCALQMQQKRTRC